MIWQRTGLNTLTFRRHAETFAQPQDTMAMIMMTMVAWTHTMILIDMFVLIILNDITGTCILFMYFCQINKFLQSFLTKICFGIEMFQVCKMTSFVNV